MSIAKTSRRDILAILGGIITFLLIQTIVTFTSFYLVYQVVRTTAPQEFEAALSQFPVLLLRGLVGFVGFLAPVLAGAVAGWLVRKQGWLYGAIVGGFVSFTLISLIAFAYFAPVIFTFDYRVPSEGVRSFGAGKFYQTLFGVIKIVLLTAIGGWLGEVFYRHKRKTTSAK